MKDRVSWSYHSNCVNALPIQVVEGGRISIVAITPSKIKVLDSELVGKIGKSVR